MKKLKTNLIALFLLIASISQAQTPSWIWVKQGTGNSTNEGKAVVADPSGNIYVAGAYGQTATFGSLSVSGGDMFLAKYDQNGNIIWLKSAKGTLKYAAYDLAIDSDNNLYILGTMNSTATFGGVGLTTNGSNDVFIAKYNHAGALIWAKNYGGSKYDDVNSIAVDYQHNIIITGSFYEKTNFGNGVINSNGQSDIYIAKLDSSGTLTWINTYGNSGNDGGAAVSCDGSGNIYATGYFVDTCKIGNNILVAKGMSDVYIAKLNADGSFIWASQSVGINCNYPKNICLDNQTNVYITGTFGSTITFDSKSLTSSGGNDVFVIKYDSSGEVKWSSKGGGIGHEISYGLYANSAGEVFISGVFNQSSTFGTHSISGNKNDIYITKCNAGGSFEWVIGAGAASFDECWDITFSNDKLIAVGAFTFSVNFGSHKLSSTGSSIDMYIAAIGVPAPSSIVIKEHPKSFNKCVGDTVTLFVSAIGSGMNYQWKKNGTIITGATDSFLVINGVSASDIGSYTCTINDSSYSVTSNPGVLNLGGEPNITQQPDNKNVNKNQKVTIKITAVNATSYQWQKNGVDIDGETTNTLIFNSIQVSDEGNYRCVVSGSCGIEISNESNVSVSTAGIANEINNVLTIAPNPSYGIITISLQNSLDEIMIEILNTSGQKIIQRNIYGNNERIDLSQLQKGVYIILARSKGNSYASRIVLR